MYFPLVCFNSLAPSDWLIYTINSSAKNAFFLSHTFHFLTCLPFVFPLSHLLILFIIFQTNSHFCLFLKANYYNCKLPQFFSRYQNPGCTGVGFFVQSCEGINCLIVPPVCLFKLLEPLIIFFFMKLLPRLVFLSGPSSYLENFLISSQITISLLKGMYQNMVETHTPYLDMKEGSKDIFWPLEQILGSLVYNCLFVGLSYFLGDAGLFCCCIQ